MGNDCESSQQIQENEQNYQGDKYNPEIIDIKKI